MSIKAKIYPPCFLEFFSVGYMALLIGAIIPYLISDYGISYTVAAFFVSSQALGTLLASYLMPLLIEKIGQKTMIVILSSLMPIGISSILFTQNPLIIIIAFFLLGIGRGTVANFNNYIVNEYSTGKASTLNILHSFFAIGAFVSPLVASFAAVQLQNWKLSVLFCVIILASGTLGYFLMPLENTKIPMFSRRKAEGAKNKSYLHSFDFYIGCALMFFYVGFEYSANNWFISYYRDTGIMSESYAASLVSFLWLVILFGRLANAAISKYIAKHTQILINVCGCALFFTVVFFSKSLVLITAGTIGLGFFMAGVYPTCVASVGNLVKGSASGMSIFLAVAGLGGMLIPQSIGTFADSIGMTGAISILFFVAIIVIILALMNYLRQRRVQ